MLALNIASDKKIILTGGCPGGLLVKVYSCQCRRPMFDPWVVKVPWRKKCQPTPVYLLDNPRYRGAWGTTVHEAARAGHDLATKPPFLMYKLLKL